MEVLEVLMHEAKAFPNFQSYYVCLVIKIYYIIIVYVMLQS